MRLEFKVRTEFKEGKVFVDWELKGSYKPFYVKLIKNEIDSYFLKETPLSLYSTSYASSMIDGSFTIKVSNVQDLEAIQELIDNILENIKDIIKYNLITLPRKVIRLKMNLQGITTLVVPVTEFLKALS